MSMTNFLLCVLIALCLKQTAAQTYLCGVCPTGTSCDYNTGKCQQFRQPQTYQQPGGSYPVPTQSPCQTCQTTNSPTCPPNSHYSNCGSACPLRCDQISAGACTANCIAGCVCNDFYVQVSSMNKTCVRRESCPPPPTGYNDCTRIGCSYGQVCSNGQCVPVVPTTTRDPVTACPYLPPSATPPTNCRYEYSTDSNGCRVQKLVCPPPEQCGPNSSWFECSGTCHRFCDSTSTIISTCNNSCLRGCACNQGYVFQSSNRSLGCIPESQCTKREDPCGYTQCPYGQVCSNGQCIPVVPTTTTKAPVTACPYLPPTATPPTNCRYEYSTDSNGCRVQKLVCPEPGQCGANSKWFECSGTCHRFCDQTNKIISTCNNSCLRGCACNQGYVFQSSNRSLGCIPESQCTGRDDPCGYVQCPYGQTCSNGKCLPPVTLPGPPATSPPSCPYVPPTPTPSGCQYETSYDSNGCRVQKLICPTCGENEEEKLCLICDQYCDKSVKSCSIQCPKSTHCGCKSGYFRNATDKCVAVC